MGNIETLYEEFSRDLTSGGWSSTSSGSGTMYRKDRCAIAMAMRDGALIWTVFPTPPPLPRGVVTKPHPIPLATYSVHAKDATFDVWTHVVDRSGALSKRLSITGDAPTIFERLLRESVEAVDDFVRGVERR